MSNTKRRSAQLSVAAVAALAIFAVAAVMLLAGSTPAQATNTALTPDDGAAQQRPQQTDPTPTPRHTPPEACPGETGNPNSEAASVVSSGQIALFDVWWNPVEKELTNTSCPPTVEHTPANEDEETPAKDVRSPSNIDIDTTVIHIPNSARIDLNAPGNPYTKTKYPALWDADKKEDRDTNGDGTPDGVGDGIVWALPACPPAGAPETDELCIMYSAALLNKVDWATSLKKPNGKVDFLLDHIHQSDIDVQDPRYALAYAVPTPAEAASTEAYNPLWDSSDVQIDDVRDGEAQSHKVQVAPGEYVRPMLFFTDRATYTFRVEVKGYPDRKIPRADGLKPVSWDRSVSSDERDYIIHVGALADLSVGSPDDNDNQILSVANADSEDKTIDPGDDITITVTAGNVGPEAVPATNVAVTLPPGLTYASHAPAGAEFDEAEGVRTWKAGSLASGASKTLTVTATVDAETHGQEFAVKAAISGTEPAKITETNDQGVKSVEDYDLPVLDPDPSNDTAAATFTVATTSNTDPMFFVTRSIPENSAASTKVGDPVGVKDPQTDDTLTFTLTGTRAHKFTVSSVSGGAQIAVANGAILDYETVPMYDLVLGVSDGKDANGNADDTVDHTIGVLINLENVADDPSLAISANPENAQRGRDVTLTATTTNLPEGHGTLTYHWIETDASNGSTTTEGNSATRTENKIFGGVAPIIFRYQVEVSWTIDGVETRIRSSNEVTVIWQ